MRVELIIELAMLVIVIIQFITLTAMLSKTGQERSSDILQRLAEYAQRLEKNETALRDEFGKNRQETNRAAKDSREELSSSLKSVSGQLASIITNFTGLVDNKIKAILDSLETSSKTNREELNKSISVFEEKVTRSITGFSEVLNKELKSVQDRVNSSTRESREELAASLKSFEEKSSARIEALTKDTKDGLEKNRDAVEKKLADIQQSNEKKLDEMRQTVDEKLQKTLETRLTTSFKTVSEHLEQVQKGLGEMKNLASNVGDLKKVMSGSSSKIKGVLGEYQLAAILEQTLASGQYAKNVKTKAGSDRNVEFAIKIPNKDDTNKTVWLPIDSKLPTSGYETLVDAYNSGDKKAIEDAQKAFARTVKTFAKDIRDKYIDPPNTTDFAIMFLPFESEYAEAVRDADLFESIQRDYKINITGPSTISAFLNALQVGFRSLAVEKQTGKIWNILGEVKKEFGNFEVVLTKVKDQIDKAGATLEKDVGVRTRAINRTLKKVETLPSDDNAGQKLLIDDYTDAEEPS
ncbi:MAG: DNA recombination protein RmuC [Spirochaetaceae bacterium]|jgi:DNA recombination protein RmuC|nr:DNA recombination protein RmuC [Spirochaetaceae bacterium]